jgi:hypothetical protein
MTGASTIAAGTFAGFAKWTAEGTRRTSMALQYGQVR